MRHYLESAKVVAGKKGSVTGFTGSISLGLTVVAREDAGYMQLFTVLCWFAPYWGTGHKTTFGLEQTRLGWRDAPTTAMLPSTQDLLAQRISELTSRFLAAKKRSGSDLAITPVETWATILVRRELGKLL